ncbi:MAG TPA: hypothetical protein O0X01_07880, partial [Methanocorpusculum sp.]|nr:hypothetical protein [Methanocorpusculum sp.]
RELVNAAPPLLLLMRCFCFVFFFAMSGSHVFLLSSLIYPGTMRYPAYTKEENKKVDENYLRW